MAPSNISLSHIDALNKNKRDSAPLEPDTTSTDAAINERNKVSYEADSSIFHLR